ncbi:MAG TPA: RNA polymerase sigma factor [Chloroflexota bacterium]
MVPQTPDDSALTAAARGGELAAFNQLVERYQGVVYNLCLRMLGDPSSAEDAAQEAFFAAYRSIKSYRGGAFRGWLLRIAANQCYDALRHRQRHHTQILSDEPLVPDPSPLPDDLALSREAISTLERAIAHLAPEQRLCVLLIDVQGLDYEEAAQAIGANLGTVKSRLSRARAHLRELLGPEFRLKGGE